MTLMSLTPGCSPPDSTTMPSYQLQSPATQPWDRWQLQQQQQHHQHHQQQPQAQPQHHQHHHHQQQQQTSQDYSLMNALVPFDPRAVQSTTAALQRVAMTSAQYTLPTSYVEAPITPVSASPYGGGQSHFGDYQSYNYQPSASSAFTQMPVRSPMRPTAPPTPPLEEEHDAHTDLKNPRESVSSVTSVPSAVPTVKSEAAGEYREIKTCPKYVKTDGSLQFESKKPVDVFLRVARGLVMRPRRRVRSAATPESIASPVLKEAKTLRGFKKFQCDVCPQRFQQKAQLKTHQRSHTGEKPHKCDECGMRVSQPGNLKAHKRKHTKEKPYGCPTCNLKFSSNGGLKVHIRNKHEYAPKQPCPMEDCRKEFSTIGNMKVHIGKFHSKELDKYLQIMLELESFEGLPERLQTLLATLLRIYKNSNCGIKGRGAAARAEREAKLQNTRREVAVLQVPSMNPASNNVAPSYDQNQFHGLPGHSQPLEQPAAFLPSSIAPHSQPQPVYHGLPQPTAYGLGWPQYH